jgi:hypothetical protein
MAQMKRLGDLSSIMNGETLYLSFEESKKDEEKNLPSLSLGCGGSAAVVVLNTPVAAAAVNIWKEEEEKRGVRGMNAASALL